MRPCPSLRMEIGDPVIYNGRSYVLRGLEPMGVDDRRALLEHPESAERFWVPLCAVSPAEPGDAA